MRFHYVPNQKWTCPKLNFTLSQTVKGVTGCRVTRVEGAAQIYIM